MKVYYDFGDDEKYLKNVRIKIVEDNSIDHNHYNPKEKTIYIKKSCSNEPNVLAHEQSHAIIDRKYRIWEKIINPFYEKYGDVYNDILEDVTNEMWNEIKEKFNEASERLYKLYSCERKMKVLEERVQNEFEKRCIIDVFCYGNFFKSLNELSINVAKRFGEEYGNKLEFLVEDIQKIQGLDELLAHAVGEQVLGGDAIYYKGYYLFEGSGTIYKIWKMLKEKGYSYVSDKLFYQRVERAKKLISEIII